MFYKLSLPLGADDVTQLMELSSDEFQQLCSMISMDKKPFHVLRLKKALEKRQLETTTPTTQTRQLSPTLYSLPAVTPDNSRELSTSHSSTVFNDPSPITPALIPVRSIDQQDTTSRKSFLPPFLQSDSQSSDFSSILDSETHVQNALGPPPCRANTWDKKRKAIIRKHAVIHHDNVREFEQHVNEASYQLCLRDPTLLVRKDELCLLSKRAVRQGYDHNHINTKPSLSVAPVVGTKRDLNLQEDTPQAKRNFCDPHEKLFTRERLSRMKTLQAEMHANVALQKVKLIAMDEAKSRGDMLTSQTLQEHIDSLMSEQQYLTGAYNVLKRKQSRSERYFKYKERKNASDELNTSSMESGPALSPIEPLEISVDDQPPGPPLTKDADGFPVIELKPKKHSKRKTTPTKIKTERDSSASNDDDPPAESAIKNLVDNISNATDQMNSIFGKKEW